MPQLGGIDSRAQPRSDAEVVVTVQPVQGHKDTRPPLWTIPVLIVAVRMLQSRNEPTPSCVRSTLCSYPKPQPFQVLSKKH